MKLLVRWFLAATLAGWASIAAAASEPSAAAPAAAAPPRPAIWLVEDEDTRIYLFGTVHILPPRLQWRSAELDRIVAETDELVMELGEDEDSLDAQVAFSAMVMDKSVPILARVSPEHREPLRRMIQASGIPIDAFDRMHGWAASMALVLVGIREAYLEPGMAAEELTGVEDALRADFERTGRPISGVETIGQQLGFFSGMTLRTQRLMIESMVDSYVAGEPALEPDDTGWLSGDVEAIAAEMAEMPSEMTEILLTRRNAVWTDWLIARLDRPGRVLFAVGAGHLAGPVSVQAMLAERGVKVRRVS